MGGVEGGGEMSARSDTSQASRQIIGRQAQTDRHLLVGVRKALNSGGGGGPEGGEGGNERIYMQETELRNATEECQSCHGDERWSPTFQTPALEPPFHKNGLLPKISVQSTSPPTT